MPSAKNGLPAGSTSFPTQRAVPKSPVLIFIQQPQCPIGLSLSLTTLTSKYPDPSRTHTVVVLRLHFPRSHVSSELGIRHCFLRRPLFLAWPVSLAKFSKANKVGDHIFIYQSRTQDQTQHGDTKSCQLRSEPYPAGS